MIFDRPTTVVAKEIEKLVSAAKYIIITSHKSFDDDSIGSVLAMYWTVKEKHPGKKVRVVYTGKPDERHKYFSGYQEIEFVDDLAWYLKGCDLLIMLDGGQFNRFTGNPELIQKFKGKTICLDHHQSPPDKFSLSLISPKSAATCQIIYELFCRKTDISKSVAEPLLLGLLGDTGNFTYLRPSDLGTFDMAKDLIAKLNVEVQEFKSRYDLISPRSFALEKIYVANTKLENLEGWGGFSWTYVDREFLQKESYSDNEASDGAHVYMSSYLRLIAGAPWGFIITPKQDGSCSVSFRSLPRSVNVRSIVEGMKIGGGHDRAAGSNIKSKKGGKTDPIECYQKIISWMRVNSAIIS